MRTILYKACEILLPLSLLFFVGAIFLWPLLYVAFGLIAAACVCDVIAERMGRKRNRQPGVKANKGSEVVMSKFEYESFYGGYDNFAVSKQKFTKEEAIEIAKKELCYGNPKHTYLAVGNGFVRHRAGINEDGEPCVGWWLEYSEHKRSCPCWVFHLTPNKEEKFFKGYEYIKITI